MTPDSERARRAGGHAPESNRRPTDPARRTRERLRSRRGVLGAVGAGVVALSGCLGGGDDGSAATPTPTPTATPTATPTPSPTPTSTPTATPEPEVVVLDVEPQSEFVVYTFEPDDGPVRVRLENFYLYVVGANDGKLNTPNTEELYGAISVEGYDGSGRVLPTFGQTELWRRDGNRALEIAERNGEALTTRFDPVFEFPAGVDRSEAYVELTPNLYEADKGLNDDDTLDRWKEHVRWYLDQPMTAEEFRPGPTGESSFTVGFDDRGTYVRLSFDVRPA